MVRLLSLVLILWIVPVQVYAGVFDAETEASFTSSCRAFVEKPDGKNIVYEKFIKKPDSFIGDRVQFKADIYEIHQEGSYGMLRIKAVIAGHRDIIVIDYYGTGRMERGDKIEVYGEGDGSMTTKETDGKRLVLPRILAKFIHPVKETN